MGDFQGCFSCGFENPKKQVFPATQLGSDDLFILRNFGLSSLESFTYGFYRGWGLENFINHTRY
jgi:hypothetical protein